MTNTPPPADGTQQAQVSQVKVYRDRSGRERTESFYDSGKPMSVMLRDPNQNSIVIMKLVEKTAVEIPLVRPQPPPPGRGWTVEQLPQRVIAGYAAMGQRFRRTIPAGSGKVGQAVTTVEDVWISSELGVVLELTFDDSLGGRSVKTVTALKRVEPDPALFAIPAGYAIEKAATASQSF